MTERKTEKVSEENLLRAMAMALRTDRPLTPAFREEVAAALVPRNGELRRGLELVQELLEDNLGGPEGYLGSIGSITTDALRLWLYDNGIREIVYQRNRWTAGDPETVLSERAAKIVANRHTTPPAKEG